MGTESSDFKDRFHKYYGEYFAGRNVRYNALQTVAQLHALTGDPDPPSRQKAIEALFDVLGSSDTGSTLEDSAAVYDKLREDAGLYNLK
jgi:hypothetical protein